MQHVSWRKSRYSDAHGQCVEVARAPGGVWVRDSRRAPVRLGLTARAWAELLAALKARGA